MRRTVRDPGIFAVVIVAVLIESPSGGNGSRGSLVSSGVSCSAERTMLGSDDSGSG